MPLKKDSSKKSLERNIKTEIEKGNKDPKQAAAIGYSIQKEAKKKGK